MRSKSFSPKRSSARRAQCPSRNDPRTSARRPKCSSATVGATSLRGLAQRSPQRFRVLIGKWSECVGICRCGVGMCRCGSETCSATTLRRRRWCLNTRADAWGKLLQTKKKTENVRVCARVFSFSFVCLLCVFLFVILSVFLSVFSLSFVCLLSVFCLSFVCLLFASCSRCVCLLSIFCLSFVCLTCRGHL